MLNLTHISLNAIKEQFLWCGCHHHCFHLPLCIYTSSNNYIYVWYSLHWMYPVCGFEISAMFMQVFMTFSLLVSLLFEVLAVGFLKGINSIYWTLFCFSLLMFFSLLLAASLIDGFYFSYFCLCAQFFLLDVSPVIFTSWIIWWQIYSKAHNLQDMQSYFNEKSHHLYKTVTTDSIIYFISWISKNLTCILCKNMIE